MAEVQQTIESKTQFTDDAVGWAARWNVEMTAAKKNQEKFLERGDKVVKRFLDNRDMRNDGDTRVNLFTANVQTLRALLYGKSPSVDVKRRWADPNDDEARVAGEILQRLLNCDIESDDDSYATALENALDDRLLPGLGVVRVRYEADFEEREVPPILAPVEPFEEGEIESPDPRVLAPGYTKTEKIDEDVETDYVHWRDFRWSPARTWDEIRWVAFKAYMTKDAIRSRFGEEAAKRVPLAMQTKNPMIPEDDGLKHHPWMRAEVWEIWNKDDRKVYWWVSGYDRILDVKDDPLGLEGFWPMPRPMFANATTTNLMPTPDFTIAQDLYDEVDMISTRITLLERAVAVRGVYDKTSEEIKRLISEAVINELIPVDNFAMFKEKGGLGSVIDWLPLDMIVNALTVLRDYRTELMALLFQVTGMSDIMRGQASGNATATEQALKAKFASTRIQELQNEFARFASDCQSIKAEIVSKHFDPRTIIERSNVKYMTGSDPQIAIKAIQIIKSDIYQYRIEVKPESVAMADMAAVKQERAEFLMAIAQFFQSAVPMVQVAPFAMPYMLQILQWSVAAFRGSASIEGVFDQMVVAANQAAQAQAQQPPPPDPKIEALKLKAGIDQQKAKMDMVGKVQDLKIKAQSAQMDLAKKAMELKLQAQQNAMEQDQSVAEHDMNVRKMEHEIQRDALKGEVQVQVMKEKAKAAKEKPRGGKDS